MHMELEQNKSTWSLGQKALSTFIANIQYSLIYVLLKMFIRFFQYTLPGIILQNTGQFIEEIPFLGGKKENPILRNLICENYIACSECSKE